MRPSKRQLAIYDAWQNTNHNILINAVAGSGKSTVLLEILKYCEYRTLYVAFNKGIQEEIQAKIETRGLKQGKAITMHSMGLSSIRNSGIKFKVENSKNYNMLRELMAQEKKIFNGYPWEDRLKLMYTLMDMNDISRQFLTNDKDTILDLAISMDKPSFTGKSNHIDTLWEKLLKAREASYDSPLVSLDFTDMIYLPVLKNLYIPFDPTYLLLDEAQDFNLAQHALIDLLLSQGTVQKWAAAGDRNQSIYGFAGSYEASFDMFKRKENVVELDLDICYRCPQDVIASANEIYPVMTGFKTETGIVKTLTSSDSVKPGSMVICRNRNPLIELYFDLVKKGIPATVIGDDILGSVTKFLKPYTKLSIDVALNKMGNELFQRLRIVEPSREDQIKTHYLNENIENFETLLENLNGENSFRLVSDLLDKIKELFSNKENAVTLCTIHKSKGLEADVVYILEENLIPSKFAKSPQQLKQEQNLKYVARTRAKEEMYFLNLKE